MDTGKGRLEQFNKIIELPDMIRKFPKWKSVFKIGEEIEIKGSLLKVKDISPFSIKPRILKQP